MRRKRIWMQRLGQEPKVSWGNWKRQVIDAVGRADVRVSRGYVFAGSVKKST
jgi:hypothetical protein